MKTLSKRLLILLACPMLLVGCGKSGGDTVATGSAVIIPPAQRCGTTVYTNWDAQRNCLVNGYQAEVNRCLTLATDVQRGECVRVVRNAYVGAESASVNSWSTDWGRYTTALDPYYQNLNAYNANWANRYQMDIWQNYYQRAVATTYYNQLYVAAYNQAYANSWRGYGGYYYY